MVFFDVIYLIIPELMSATHPMRSSKSLNVYAPNLLKASNVVYIFSLVIPITQLCVMINSQLKRTI